MREAPVRTEPYPTSVVLLGVGFPYDVILNDSTSRTGKAAGQGGQLSDQYLIGLHRRARKRGKPRFGRSLTLPARRFPSPNLMRDL